MATPLVSGCIPAPRPGDKKRWLRRIYFRIATIILSTIAVVALVLFLSSPRNRRRLPFMPTLAMCLAIMSVLWFLANLIVAIGWRYSMPDGAVVTLDLLAWLGFAVVGTLEIIFNPYPGADLYDPYRLRKRANNGLGLGASKTVGIIGYVGGAALLLNIIPHFVLFVWGCMDCHSRRLAELIRKEIRAFLPAENMVAKA